MKLLVAYASKYGSTAEIAEVIGKELRKREYEVEVKSVDEVDSLAGYDGFVIGSALYAGGWLKAAAEFLRSNQEALANYPVWLFSSGPTGEGDPNEIMGGEWTFPEDLAAVREAIQPKDVILFHGKIDLDKLSFGERMIIKSVKATVGDYRDWLVIRTWASLIQVEPKAG
ncbi:MAG: flavodoxin [Anaerolineales bacterium]|nr:flavodoxin [Anaerolineales bacterium]